MSRNRAALCEQVMRRRGQLAVILRHEKLVLPRRVSRPLQEADAGEVTLVFLPQMPDQPR